MPVILKLDWLRQEDYHQSEAHGRLLTFRKVESLVWHQGWLPEAHEVIPGPAPCYHLEWLSKGCLGLFAG